MIGLKFPTLHELMDPLAGLASLAFFVGTVLAGMYGPIEGVFLWWSTVISITMFVGYWLSLICSCIDEINGSKNAMSEL